MSAKKEVSRFSRERGYIWAMLGSAIGFGNILSFSATCYQNGGGAFLIPYVVAILTLGIPMLFLEGLIGHRLGLPLVPAYEQVGGRLARFFGWLAIIAVTTIGAFYMVLTAFSVAYTYFSGAGTIPTDTLSFFKNGFLHDSGDLSVWGGLSVAVFGATIIVALISWLILIQKVQSGIEKICAIFMPMLALVVFSCAIAVMFFPGAWEGFYYYLKPDFSKLSDFKLWRDIFGQLFFSFSLGIGIVTGYSRYTGESTKIRRAMILVATGDFLISFIAGFAIFGFIGYLSHISGEPISSIVQSDSAFQVGFVIFPMILRSFGPLLSNLFGILFFFCIFIAGITGVFSIVEALSGNIELEFGKKRRVSITISLIIMTIMAIPFCMGNGLHILGALEPMVIGENMLIGGIAEVIFFMYISKSISHDPLWLGNFKGHSLAYYCIKFVAPIILAVCLIGSIFIEFQRHSGLQGLVRWSWFFVAVIIAAVLSLRPRHQQLSFPKG